MASPRDRNRLSSSLNQRRSSARGHSLLKAALTKNHTTFDFETPDNSANNTSLGIRKAKAIANEFQETPRTVLAAWHNKEENVVVADDLFNAAKAATKARRERTGRSASKRKDVLQPEEPDEPSNAEVDDENLDPMELSKSPSPMKNALKRKSRLIKNRRLTQDDSRDEQEESQNDSDLVNALENTNPLPQNTQRLKRRATRSTGRVLRQSNQEIQETELEESNIEDSIEDKIAAHERQNKVLTRRRTTIMAATKVASQPSIEEEADTEDDDDDIEDLEKIERKIQELKMMRKSRGFKQATVHNFENIRRAPTPVKTVVNDNLSRRGKDIDAAELAEEADMSFHPNVESTRVGAGQIFADSESSTAGSRNSKEAQDLPEPQGSPKSSSRKRTASRQKLSESLKYALVTEDDRGSYLAATESQAKSKKSPEKLAVATEPVDEDEEDAQSFGDNGADGYENVESDHEENEPEGEEQVDPEVSIRRRQSQELMPPPSSAAVQRTTRNRALDSLIVGHQDKLDFAGVEVQEEKSSRRARKKKANEKPKRPQAFSDETMKIYFEEISGLKLGKDGLKELKVGINSVMDAMDDWLMEKTCGRKPQLGDYKDAMVHFQLIEEDDNILAKFQDYLDYEDIVKLFPIGTLDGTVGGGCTMREDAWDVRAADLDDSGDENFKVFGQRKKRKSKKK